MLLLTIFLLFFNTAEALPETRDEQISSKIFFIEDYERLHDIIDDLIEDLENVKDKLSLVTSEVTLNTLHIQGNSDDISKVFENLTFTLDLLSTNLTTEIRDVSKRVYENKNSVTELKSNSK